MESSTFLKLIYSKIDEKKYLECTSLLRKEIISLYALEVKRNNNNYSYSSTVELFEETKKYLSDEKNVLYAKFFNIINDDNLENNEKTYLLLEIYKDFQKI